MGMGGKCEVGGFFLAKFGKASTSGQRSGWQRSHKVGRKVGILVMVGASVARVGGGAVKCKLPSYLAELRLLDLGKW